MKKLINLYVTLDNFLPINKKIPQFLIKGKLFLERERGREKDTVATFGRKLINSSSFLQK